MRIEIRGRNTEVSEQLEAHIFHRFKAIGKQVSELADLEIELTEEPTRAVADRHVAEATLHLKGVTLRAHETSPDMLHSVNLIAEDMARQVKRHREKRRNRQTARRFAERLRRRAAPQTEA